MTREPLQPGAAPPSDRDGFRARLEEWDAVLESCTYYDILSVEPLAGEQELRAAYHRFARAFHPDSHHGAEPDLISIAQRVFERGAEAYRVLTHPELRIRYDMALARGRKRLLPSDVPAPHQAAEEGRPLHELCRSAGAKLAAQKAARLIDAGDPKAARRELLSALQYDGGANPAIQERIDSLDVILYAMGESAPE